MVHEPLTNSETYIMKVVWSSPEDISVMDLISGLRDTYGRDYQRTTISTFLLRLENKGFVSTYKKKKFSYVHAEISEDEYRAFILSRETDFWFSGSAADHIAALCSTRALSKDEIEAVRRILDDLDN